MLRKYSDFTYAVRWGGVRCSFDLLRAFVKIFSKKCTPVMWKAHLSFFRVAWWCCRRFRTAREFCSVLQVCLRSPGEWCLGTPLRHIIWRSSNASVRCDSWLDSFSSSSWQYSWFRSYFDKIIAPCSSWILSSVFEVTWRYRLIARLAQKSTHRWILSGLCGFGATRIGETYVVGPLTFDDSFFL